MEATTGGDSERDIETSLLRIVSSAAAAAAVVFLFLASSTAVVGDRLSCKSGGVESSVPGSGRLWPAPLSAGGEVEALGSTCFCL
jgi:hypothetical protein